MGLKGPCGEPAEPRVYEVYGSGTRLSFSRYFVVAHVDGFIYVLDKYFCISRLVPAPHRRRGSHSPSGAQHTARGPNDVAWEGPCSHAEVTLAGSEGGSRQVPAEHVLSQDRGYLRAAEGAQAERHMVPVRIADVFSALFRTNKPVFSQLLTGNSQYDQRELQALRQKSLLLSSRRDGCLYLFLKKFLLRVSLRGTVTVVGDLLQLALAAAARLCPDKPPGLAPSGGLAGPPASPQPVSSEDGEFRLGAASPVFRVNSLSHVARRLGGGGATYDSAYTAQPGMRRRATSPPVCRSPSHSVQLDESAASRVIRAHVLQNVRRARERLQPGGASINGAACPSERLQDFLVCRGKGWEVNNCCIDGEGRCFFTVTYEKALSPLQQRGKDSALPSSYVSTVVCNLGAVVRARVLRFGRGVAENAVLSLSLSAHPVSGCFLLVVKSASAVLGNLLNSASVPIVSGVAETNAGSVPVCNEGGEIEAAQTSRQQYSLGTMSSEACTEISTHNESAPPGTLPLRSTTIADNAVVSPAVVSTSHQAGAGYHGLGSNDEAQNNPPLPTEQPAVDLTALQATSEDRQPTLSQAQPGAHAVETASLLGSLGERQATASRAADNGVHGEEALDDVGEEKVAEEHSMWWFCPCPQDAAFYFPAAEWLQDEAVHRAAQSICHQFRGSPSTSVCRAHFGEDCSVAVSEATAASAAAYTAAALVATATEAAVQREMEMNASSRSARASRYTGTSGHPIDQAVHMAASKALLEAATAAARAESAASRGYILWQPGVKVKRPKTGEQVIDFGSAIVIRALAGDSSRGRRSSRSDGSICLKGRRSLELITGEPVAVISQDARHLEVRDALPSPLGFIVVPAEAANRIVKQHPCETAGRLSSRNTLSLTSFLSSFVVGGAHAVQHRGEGANPTNPASGTGSDEGRQQPEADVHGASADVVPAAGPSQMPESFYQRAIPAVNIVFLVDTLRLCRFAEPSSAGPEPQITSQKWALHEVLLGNREHSPPGRSEASTAGAGARSAADDWDSIKSELGLKHSSDSSVDGLSASWQSTSRLDLGRRCSCQRNIDCCSEEKPAPALHPHFADVLLLCADGVEIPSHRALLAARCSFFEAKLTRNHWEASGNDKVVIDLREFPGSVVKAAVQYFETGSFSIPATCCCQFCCPEKRRLRMAQQHVIPSSDSRCSCRINWVLQAHTFASYCLLHDLHAELLSVLARLISQRSCLHVLTHPAVRGQQQILELAAHQLAYYMPMPNLLLDTNNGLQNQLKNTTAEDTSPESLQGAASSSGENPKCLLPQLLNEGVYKCVVTALQAWVLDSQQNALFLSKLQLITCANTTASELRARQLLVLLALRLLQESVAVPSTSALESLDFQCPDAGLSGEHTALLGNPDREALVANAIPVSTLHSERTWLVVPVRDSGDAVQYFKFKDVVLLWAKLLNVPEQDAKVVAQEAEDLGLP
ncbi:hypothetical protein Efla_003317 [Eimeria flavescens]